MNRKIVDVVIGCMLLLLPLEARAVLPGDSNRDGTVSIAEVQTVINAFLGLIRDPGPAPTAFTTQYLSGKTFYQVWFGIGYDANGNEIQNVPVVMKMVFGADGTVQGTSLLNGKGGSIAYSVTDAGLLYLGTDPSEGNVIVSGSTSDYIKTYYTINGAFDNVDLFFYDETTAMNFARLLTAQIAK